MFTKKRTDQNNNEQSRQNNNEKSYTEKKAKHEPSGWAIITEEKIVLKKTIQEYAMKIMNYEKKK